MLRAVLVGLLSVSAAVACKSTSDAPASQPGVAVGTIIEVSGTVTVRHGAVARPLAKGDSVEGDDVVETGADGNVIVELAHNLARWELGPNKKSKVRESAAWGLPKKSGDVANVQQDTAAAGRPAERSAADTSVSAAVESTSIETTGAPGAPAAPAAAPPAAAPVAPAAPAVTAAPPPPPRATEQSPRAETPAKVKRAREMADALDNASGGGAAPTRGIEDVGTVGGGGEDGGGGGEDGGGVRTRGGTAKSAGASAAPPPPPASAPSSPDVAARDLVVRHQASIKACLTKDMQAVSLRVVVDADGKATVVVNAKTEVPDGVKQCVTSAVQKISFAKASGTVTLDVAR